MSALYFSQFILGLYPFLASIRDSLENLETKDLCWRLDHIGWDHEFQQAEQSLRGRIEDWLAGLPPVASGCVFGFRSFLTRAPSPAQAVTIIYSNHPLRSPQPLQVEAASVAVPNITAPLRM